MFMPHVKAAGGVPHLTLFKNMDDIRYVQAGVEHGPSDRHLQATSDASRRVAVLGLVLLSVARYCNDPRASHLS